jgi:hypothetical protein
VPAEQLSRPAAHSILDFAEDLWDFERAEDATSLEVLRNLRKLFAW